MRLLVEKEYTIKKYGRTFLLVAIILFLFHGKGMTNSDSLSDPEKSIGLTLSGGGARGLAHVGVLHIIDSLGIRIDYITGTSMGSIVGGMYAAGYSAAEIEDFALGMDWESMFSRRVDLAYIHPVLKDKHQQYIVELPIEDRRIKTPTGAIEGQQLWNTLNEVFFHTFHIRDFRNLPIPFACVATNAENGEAVVMMEGDLVTAIRASMAIPSVFTTVERGGMKLIDGGVVNNFPTDVVRDMGADYIIGVNVSQGLRPSEELITPIDIIYQMGFYSEARSFLRNRELTDLFIDIPLEGFTVASFGQAHDIIEHGKEIARKNLTQFIPLSKRDPDNDQERIPGKQEAVMLVDTILFLGLKEVRPEFVRNTIDISPGDTITARKISRAISRLYASNYFNRVHYHFEANDNEEAFIITIDFDERPIASVKGSVLYSAFSGIGIVAGLGVNRLFHYNTKASASFLIGEQPAFYARIISFMDERRRHWLQFKTHGRRLTFPLYDNFQAVSEYNQGIMKNELSINSLMSDDSYFSIKAAYLYQSLSPNMITPNRIEGNNRAFTVGLDWNYNTLNRNVFPTSGQRFTVRGTYFFSQQPNIPVIKLDGQSATLEDLGIKLKDFFQIQASGRSYVRLGNNLTQIMKSQFGYNFDSSQGFINSFNLGGTYQILENQLTFIGLNEYEVISESLLVTTLGYQYHLGRGVYATSKLNAALYDFKFTEPEQISSDNFVFGGGLSLGYDSIIGPFELTFSYSPQAGHLIGYINIGWTF